MTTEAGGFTLDGEAFTGGAESPVEGEGGRTYVLTLADGTWSAAFQPMEVMVPLGASGESATLMTTEAGGFSMDGAAFEAGGLATSTEGARYTLTMDDDGMWMATFMPMTQTVALGISDNTVELMTNEAGVWMLGEMELGRRRHRYPHGGHSQLHLDDGRRRHVDGDVHADDAERDARHERRHRHADEYRSRRLGAG